MQAVPGPSAITAALAVAGLPTDRFCFEGFLPAREGERRAQSRGAGGARPARWCFSKRRIASPRPRDIAAAFGAERRAAVARELTKVHETVYRGTLAQLAQRGADEANFARGEITVVVQGAPAAASAVDRATCSNALVELLAKELPPGKAAALAAQLTGATRNDAYALAINEAEAATEADDR